MNNPIKTFLLAALLFGVPVILNAQDFQNSKTENIPESGVSAKESFSGAPIGGGVSILITLGLAFGLNRILAHQKSSSDMT
jgi:hypothetical protein